MGHAPKVTREVPANLIGRRGLSNLRSGLWGIELQVVIAVETLCILYAKGSILMPNFRFPGA